MPEYHGRKIERPYWFLDEDLAYLFGYNSRTSARQAATRGTFPIPLFRLRTEWCADRRVVIRYFQEIRADQMAQFAKFIEEGRYHVALG